MAITLENRNRKTETGKKPEAGFALLIAIIFMSVMLSFGLALGSLGYKQQVLASGSIESQYAFYAADAALECALYADQQQGLFTYTSIAPPSAPAMTCDNAAPLSATIVSHSGTEWVVTERVSLDSGKRCADVTVYKPAPGAGVTYLFSQGYDVSCATVASPDGARFVSRGINAHYGGSPTPGVCGSANGTTVSSAPSTNLCVPSSSASSVFGSGPWTWSCASTNGGSSASCSANASTINGVCAPTHYNCDAGTSISPRDRGGGYWTWRCQGSGGGSTSSCSETTTIRVNGVCAPTHYNCDAGTSISPRDRGGDYWTWRCQGSGGGSSRSCSERL